MNDYKLPINYPDAVRIIKESILKLQDSCAKLEMDADDSMTKVFYQGEQQGLHLAFEKIMDQIPV